MTDPALPPVRFVALPTSEARALQTGGPDAHGQTPERKVSDGSGNPCRHCLRDIPEGAGMLVLAHRPFRALQPYAETGPIFLCADPCDRFEGEGTPPALAGRETKLLKGYAADERIVYGTGRIVPTERLAAEAAATLRDPRVAFVHLRSARNNCYQARVDRA
jgi:hypothetical protein